MHKHISTRRNPLRSRRCPIPRVRIRNVNRLVKLTVRIPRIENVDSLRSLVIPLPRLRPYRISTQRHPIRFDDLPPVSNCSMRSFFSTTTRSACNGLAAVCAITIPHSIQAVSTQIRMPGL